MKSALAGVLSGFFEWAAGREIDVRKYRYELPLVVGELLQRYGLTQRYAALMQGGRIRPETLLFTAFGLPGHIGFV